MNRYIVSAVYMDSDNKQMNHIVCIWKEASMSAAEKAFKITNAAHIENLNNGLRLFDLIVVEIPKEKKNGVTK